MEDKIIGPFTTDTGVDYSPDRTYLEFYPTNRGYESKWVAWTLAKAYYEYFVFEDDPCVEESRIAFDYGRFDYNPDDPEPIGTVSLAPERINELIAEDGLHRMLFIPETDELKRRHSAYAGIRVRQVKPKGHSHHSSDIPPSPVLIRSYVLEPYKMVKNHLTGKEWDNPDQVLSGGLYDVIKDNLI